MNTKSSKLAYYHRNRDRINAAKRLERKEHPERFVAKDARWNRKKRQQDKTWLKELKASMSCKYCGESESVCLDFHHRDPTAKLFQIAIGLRCYGRKAMLSEIAKCDIVCANCHRKITHGKLQEIP